MAGLLPAIGEAGQFTISPTLLELQGPRYAGSLLVSNGGMRTLTIQSRGFEWIQRNGVDELRQTHKLVTSPPIVEIPPGAQQVVRVIRLGTSGTIGEEAFRVMIDELPDFREAQVPQRAIHVLLRYSVPVFAGSPAESQGSAAPGFRARINRDGEFLIKVTNPGTRRLRLADLTLGPRGREIKPFGSGLMGYVLAGSFRDWRARFDSPLRDNIRGIVPLSVTTEAGRVHDNVPIALGY